LTSSRHSLLPKRKAPSTTQIAHQTTVGGATANQSHPNKDSQPASDYDDPNTPYPADHPLAPDGSRDQCGGWEVKPDDETTLATLLIGSDVSKPKQGGSTRGGKKL